MTVAVRVGRAGSRGRRADFRGNRADGRVNPAGRLLGARAAAE